GVGLFSEIGSFAGGCPGAGAASSRRTGNCRSISSVLHGVPGAGPRGGAGGACVVAAGASAGPSPEGAAAAGAGAGAAAPGTASAAGGGVGEGAAAACRANSSST